MSDWIDVYGHGDLPAGKNCSVRLQDGTEIALFNVGGTVHATENMCMHQGGPLGDGFLEGDTVTCPWHGWQFCVTSGECLEIPGQALETYETRVENGRIQVRIPG